MDLIEEGFDEAGDLVVALDDDGKSGGLDAADAAENAVMQRAGAGVVEADEPVQLGAGGGGGGQVVIRRGGAEAGEGRGNGLFCKGRSPEAEDRAGGAGEGVNATEDGFAFTAGVCGVDNLCDARVIEEACDDVELVFCAGLCGVEPGGGDHGEDGFAPGLAPGGVHGVRLCKFDEMADGPGDQGVGAGEEALLFAGAAEGMGEVSGYGRLFCEDDAHV